MARRLVLALLAALATAPTEGLAGEGNVTALMDGGTLVLTGDALSNSLLVYHVGEDGPDTLRITGDFTTVNGVMTARVGGVTDVRVELGAGNDDVTFQEAFFAGDFTLHDDDGTDYLKLRAVQVGGGFVARTGIGDDLVELVDITRVGGAVDVRGEATTDVVLLGAFIEGPVTLVAPQGSLRIHESQIAGEVTLEMPGPGEHDLVVENRSHLLSDATVKTGDGDTHVMIRDVAGIAGTLDVTSGAGEDRVWLDNVVVVGSLRASLGDGPATVFLRNDAIVNENATVTTGSGDDLLIIRDESAVRGDLKAAVGDGGNTVWLLENSEVTGALAVEAGVGFDLLEIADGAVVQGDVKAKLGGGASYVGVLYAGRIEGALSVIGGPESDIVSIWEASLVRGNARLALGGGSNRVELARAAPGILGGLSVAGGDGADEVRTADAVIGGSVQLKLAGGLNAVSLDRTTVFGRLAVAGGAHDDVFTASQATFVGSAKILLGNGYNDIAILASFFRGVTTIKTGADDDHIDLTGTLFDTKRTIDGGGGVDVIVP